MAKKTSGTKRKDKPNSRGKNDALTKIEGIGKKIEMVLRKAGINRFDLLAKQSPDRLRQILADAGRYFQMHDPSSWPKQAELAATGDWELLKQLQAKLNNRSKLDSVDEPPEVSSSAVVFSHASGGNYQPGQPFRIERLLTPQEVQQEYNARTDEIENQFERARAAIRNLLPRLKTDGRIESGQVTAVSARYRTKFGHVVSPLHVVIGINVARKHPLTVLRQHDIEVLPKSFQGVPVKIVEGQFQLLSSQGFYLRGTQTPVNALPFTEEIAGGIPVAPLSDIQNYGTLGVLASVANQVIGLTCQHVVQGDVTAQQLDDQGHNRQIGGVVAIEPANRDVTFSNEMESVDCAKITVEEAAGEAPIRLPPPGVWTRGISHPANGPPSQPPPAAILFATRRVAPRDKDLPLWKFGNGTGHRVEGRIAILNNDAIFIEGNAYSRNYTVQLNNANGNFAVGGDSGSILALEARAYIGNTLQPVFVAVGILFAALQNGTLGLGCNMSHVIRALLLEGSIPDEQKTDDWYPR